MSEKPQLVVGIPGFTDYAIMSDGSAIISTLTDHVANQRKRPNGYMEVSIRDDQGIQRSAGVHRLVASVFVKKPVVPESVRLVVNHIDGNKTNNDYRNLEWVTYKENAEHAGRLGITSKCTPISVRDVSSGVITRYPSYIEAAKDLGVSKDTIVWRLNNGDESKVWPELKQYRRGHGNQEWSCLYDQLKPPTAGNRKGLEVRCVLTGNITQYELISDFAKARGISAAICSKWLAQPNQPVLPGFLQIKLASDPSPWRRVMDPQGELTNWGHRKRVKVVDTLTGIETIYESATACANDLKLLTTTLNLRLKTKGQKVYSDGKTFTYI